MTDGTGGSPTRELPTGTVTFLFTDVVGSTRLWEQAPKVMGPAMARHDALVERAVIEHDGLVVRPRGEGDSRFAVFTRASDAAAAAIALVDALNVEAWLTPLPIRVRVAIHTGEAELRSGDYYGSAVNRCARLRALAHPGQILVSYTTADLMRSAAPDGATLDDLGEHVLKDVRLPERVFQLSHPSVPARFPPFAAPEAQTQLDVVPVDPPRRSRRLVIGAAMALAVAIVAIVIITQQGGSESSASSTRLSLSPLALQIGESRKVTVKRGNKVTAAQLHAAVWSSADPAIATVDNTGVVHAIAAGQTVLLANVGGTIARTTVIVTVAPPPTSTSTPPTTGRRGTTTSTASTTTTTTTTTIDPPGDFVRVTPNSGLIVDGSGNVTVAVSGRLTLTDQSDRQGIEWCGVDKSTPFPTVASNQPPMLSCIGKGNVPDGLWSAYVTLPRMIGNTDCVTGPCSLWLVEIHSSYLYTGRSSANVSISP